MLSGSLGPENVYYFVPSFQSGNACGFLSPVPSSFPGKAVVADKDSERRVSFMKQQVTFSALSCVDEAGITSGVCRGVLTPYQCFHIEILLFLTGQLTGGQIGCRP